MIKPVILAGGRGTRLWPLSNAGQTKPLIRLHGERSLLQETVLRAAQLPEVAEPILVYGQDHHPQIAEHMDEIGVTRYRALLEPVGRGTAPAALAAALLSTEDDLLLVLPADHGFDRPGRFAEAVTRAAEAAPSDLLMTFGVKPDRPETGFGYIQPGAPISPYQDVYRIEAFHEKPDQTTAHRYLDSGGCFWNSGMFLFRAGLLIEEIRNARPEMLRQVRAALPGEERDRRVIDLDEAAFSACPSGSIDRMVMEKTDRGAMVTLDAGWSDLGSWLALWQKEAPDGQANVVAGPAELRSVTASYVIAGDRPVLVQGLDRIVVIDTGTGLLVASMDHAQDIRPPD